MITDIKGINVIGNKDDIENQIDEQFYNDNYKENNKKIKLIQATFKIIFVNKSIPKDIYLIDNELINKVKNNVKEIINKSKTDIPSNEKTYRMKIKKKIIDKKD